MPAMPGSGKILIVDDEVKVSDTLALILSALGYEAKVAYSAEKAIETFAEWGPDLAILDVMLPAMNGIDLAIVLKSNYPRCRLVLFSGQPDTSRLLEEAWEKGYTFEILAKPLHPTFLLDKVSNLLATNEKHADA